MLEYSKFSLVVSISSQFKRSTVNRVFHSCRQSISLNLSICICSAYSGATESTHFARRGGAALCGDYGTLGSESQLPQGSLLAGRV